MLNDIFEIWTLFMFNVYLRSFKTYSHNIWYADDCYADASLGVHVSVAYMPFDLRIIFEMNCRFLVLYILRAGLLFL
jgi:hypothetical protein